LRLVPKELGNHLQTPTLIGCKFLMIRRNINFFLLAAISEAFNYDTLFAHRYA
jgi:hypothetical protein